MALNLIKHVRAATARPLHRGQAKPDDGMTLSGHISSPGAAARPALIILGTRGVPAAHGGFETFAEKLALYMVDRGWRVTVYCQRNVAADSPLAGKTEIDQWHGIRRVLISVVGAGPRSTMVFDWRCVLHARTQAGLLLILGYNTACFLPILRMQRRPVLINMDGIEWKRRKWSAPIKLWFFLNEFIACMASSALIADHPAIRKHLTTRCSPRKVATIPYGADPVDAASPEHLRKYGLVRNGFAILIARIEPENWSLEIVRCFSRRSRRYLLVCVGPLDPERNHYHRQVKAAAGNQVIFLGPIYDRDILRSLRWHAIAYVHGHTVGGTNPSLVEALGAGNAVIAHRNHFNLWTAGSEQLYFSSENECDALFERLVDEPETARRARRAARQRHEQLFAWPRILERYENLCSRFVTARLSAPSMLLAGVLACIQPASTRAEYILGPGDKLQVAISGSITQRTTINADGQVAMPQVGYVPLAGLSISAAQSRMRDEYRAKKILLNADVLLEITEYRPFYISGDVARPGAYAFQPNITVRHAVALAGGLDMVRFRFGENPFLRAADLRHDYETLVLENLRAQLRRRRLDAELQDKSDFEFAGSVNLSVSPAVFEQAVKLEKQQLGERAALFQKEVASLKTAISYAEQDLNTLVAEVRAGDNSVKEEEARLGNVGSNVVKGVSPTTRLSEQQRDLAMARSRYLTAQSQTWTSRRSLGELRLQLERVVDTHRTVLLTELQDNSLALERIKSKMKSVAEQFAVVGGARSALYMQGQNDVHVEIHRKVDGSPQRLQATVDADVMPGDILEVDLKPGRLLGVAAVLPDAEPAK